MESDFAAHSERPGLGNQRVCVPTRPLDHDDLGQDLRAVAGVPLRRLTEKGEAWAWENPKMAQWVLTGLTLFAALVVLVTVVLRDR